MSSHSATSSFGPARKNAGKSASPDERRFKLIPPSQVLRSAIRQRADALAAAALPDLPANLEPRARDLLAELNLPEAYLGFAMVMLANAAALPRFKSVPFARRLLLLPRCLKDLSQSAPDPAANGLHAVLRHADRLGYQTLIADGMPAVVKLLSESRLDAIIGVACLDSLEASFSKIRQIGLPALALPLLSDACADTSADLDWLTQYLDAAGPALAVENSGYASLLRRANELFQPDTLDAILAPLQPRPQGGAIDSTAEIANQWLALGGKRLRPFITIAAAAAMQNDHYNPENPALERVAVAIEAFHKASLVHDDIEDGDEQRYNQPTLHRQYGQAAAINIGDYLLGLGYRLLAATAQHASPAVTAALLDQMSRAHLHLAQGQGAELAWRRAGRLQLPPGEILKMYALKTSPAFEAALACGILLGSDSPALSQDETTRLRTLSRHIGVGFQVLNDIDGWTEDCRAARPTYLTALALQSADNDAARQNIIDLIRQSAASEDALAQLRYCYEKLGVFDQADQLCQRLSDRALNQASLMTPAPLAELTEFLVNLILG